MPGTRECRTPISRRSSSRISWAAVPSSACSTIRACPEPTNFRAPPRRLSKSFPCPREQERSASSAGFAGAIPRLLASDGGAPAPRRPPARTASGGGFGRGAEPPSELPSHGRSGALCAAERLHGLREEWALLRRALGGADAHPHRLLSRQDLGHDHSLRHRSLTARGARP